MADAEAPQAVDIDAPLAGEAPLDKGLKAGAIGFVDAVIIGIASTAPAYSLAAVIGTVAATVGLLTPAVLLVAFLPMFLIASAFYYMNRVDPDCGTTFSWCTRALGPTLGWIGGWAITTTGLLVVGSLADVAARYTYLLFGFDEQAYELAWRIPFAILIVLVMTWLCVVGTELAASIQTALIVLQVGSLLIFAGVALAKVYSGDALPDSVEPSLSWLNPFDIDSRQALTAGLLTGVFIYWGWESAVNLSEESEDPAGSPGKAAVVSTVLLLVTYVGVAFAIVAFAGPALLSEFDDDDLIFAGLAVDVLGEPWDKIVVLSVLTSALASTQTTIIPASRTTLSMGRHGALPSIFGSVHRRYYTPAFSTWFIGIVSVGYYAVATAISENALYDTLTALSIMIAFYYALTGVACAFYWRNSIKRSPKDLLFVGIGPLIGSALLTYLLVEFFRTNWDPATSYSGQSWLGLSPPIFIGLGFMALGVIFLIVWRLKGTPASRHFFHRHRETVDPAEAQAVLHGGKGD